MRFQLAWYALVEFQDEITHAANEASSARRRLYLIDASERHLLEYLDLTAMDTDVRSALGLIRKVKSSVSSQLWANRPPQGGRPAQGWKAWFTIRLAGFWHIITGEQPSTSPDGPFAELVSAAWNSLHPNIPEVKWGTFVRRFARSGSLDEALFTAFIAGRFAHRIGYAQSRAVTNLAGGKLGFILPEPRA